MTTRIHDELRQQRPFTSVEAEVLVTLRRTAAVLDHAINEALRPFGITATQYNVLRILRGAGERGLCGRDVGDRMIAHVPDVPRMLERMTDAGLISRARDRDDRRHTTARITRRGLDLLDAIEPSFQALHLRALRGVTRERLRAFSDTLDVIRAQL